MSSNRTPWGKSIHLSFLLPTVLQSAEEMTINRLTTSLRPSVGRHVWPVCLPLWLHRNVALDQAKVHKQSRPLHWKTGQKLFAKIRGALWAATLKCHVTPAMRPCVSVGVHLICASFTPLEHLDHILHFTHPELLPRLAVKRVIPQKKSRSRMHCCVHYLFIYFFGQPHNFSNLPSSSKQASQVWRLFFFSPQRSQSGVYQGLLSRAVSRRLLHFEIRTITHTKTPRAVVHLVCKTSFFLLLLLWD